MPDSQTALEIERNIGKFLESRTPAGRDTSFDYCFNYFQRFREEDRVGELERPEHLQEGCLQLGFYLASWGMLRPSSFLLYKSVKFHEPIIHAVAAQPACFWEIDAHTYTRENIHLLLDFRNKLLNLPGGDYASASETLITKIMLGVFGNVPAFDTYFKRGFRGHGCCSFGEKSLKDIGQFYRQNANIIETRRQSVKTIDFNGGQETSRRYTRAKIIDMIFFIEGEKRSP